MSNIKAARRCQPFIWSVVCFRRRRHRRRRRVYVRLDMITMRNSAHGFLFMGLRLAAPRAARAPLQSSIRSVSHI